MSDPYVGEIRMFAGNFAPAGWAFCNGAILPIAENDTLFNLIGTTYGGDGQQTFALPDLQGRVPVHQGPAPGGSTYVIGERAGVETVTLTTQQLPAHSHPVVASTAGGSTANPQGNVIASSPSVTLFLADIPSVSLPPSTVTAVGGSQPHENRMPFVAINYIISLFGIFPSPA